MLWCLVAFFAQRPLWAFGKGQSLGQNGLAEELLDTPKFYTFDMLKETPSIRFDRNTMKHPETVSLVATPALHRSKAEVWKPHDATLKIMPSQLWLNLQFFKPGPP